MSQRVRIQLSFVVSFDHEVPKKMTKDICDAFEGALFGLYPEMTCKSQNTTAASNLAARWESRTWQSPRRRTRQSDEHPKTSDRVS